MLYTCASHTQMASRTSGGRRAFTLIELVAVIVILAILAGVALPKYFNHSQSAKDAADTASIAAISSALNLAYANHRATGAASGQWVTTVSGIAAVMQTQQLPAGISISGTQLVDQRGNLYTLTAETATSPATLSGGSGGSSSGGGSGGGGGSGSS